MADHESPTLEAPPSIPGQAAGQDLARLAHLVDVLPDGLVCFDREWRIVYANDEARRISRIAPEDINSRTHWELYPETVGTPLQALYYQVMATRVEGRIEYFYPPFDITYDVRVLPTDDGVALYYRDISARKQAEALRDVAVRQLDQVFAADADSVICIDRNWNCTFANRAALGILKSEELIGANLWTRFPANLEEPFASNYRTTMEQRIPTEFEAYYPEPLNIWFKVLARPFEDGIIIFASDISARKHAEAARDAAAAQLQQVFDAMTDGIVSLNQDWNYTFLNRQAAALLGRDDLLGRNMWQEFASTTADEPLKLTMQDRLPREFEVYNPAPLDNWFAVQCRASEDGIVIFFRDITDRKRAEQASDAATRQLEQVLDATTDAVHSLARDWTYTFLNKRAVEMLGRDDLLGKNIWEVFPGADIFYENYSRSMNERVSVNFEGFYGPPLNIWFSVQCRPSDDGIVVFFRDVTAERAAKQGLLDQQTTLAFLQETARVATWEIDFATSAMTFGSGSYPVMGRPCAEITSSLQLRDHIHPDDYPHIQTISRAAVETRTVAIVDYRVIAPDGSILWVESRGITIYNASGVPTHMRGMSTDITARKQNEERLLASETRYRVLTELNPQALWMGAPDGRIVYANQGFLDYIGKTLDGIGGLGWLDGFDPADQDRVVAAWTHCIATGDEYAMEARIIRARDRASRWWALRGLPIRDEFGVIQQWLGVANDIHDQKTAAEILRLKQLEAERQRAEIETVYRTAPIGLALFDPVDFRYLRLNDRQAEIVGRPAEEIVGRTLTDIAPIEGLREMFEQVRAGHPIQDSLLEGELPSRPGEHRYWSINYYPVYAPDGTVQAITAATLEITHQKKSELALIQSEKLAAVGRLASSISHEINNPLEAITNLLYIVAHDKTLPETVKSYVHMAQSELGRVSQIVTQTLRFHRQAVNRTPVTAAELVNAVLNLYQGRLTNSGIRVQATYASRTPILCFENDIRQVLNNLIANAIDAMRNGGGRLLVRAHNATHRSVPGVRITIADTGHGMSPEVRQRIFEPFYTTKDLNGTGLGLWISSGIVAHHDGRLTVRSSQHPTHHGTVFTLFLPLTPPDPLS